MPNRDWGDEVIEPIVFAAQLMARCHLPKTTNFTRIKNSPSSCQSATTETGLTLDERYGYGRNGSTGVMPQWEQFKKPQQRLGIANPKMVCIDLKPCGTSRPSSTSAASSAASTKT
ncbi:hypothetical protein RE6C_05605 [Rhodopirellula europaea 6C]|uniref:Uncharacterized protein n=1 Tax=Rhodopirellula europaea 6C TaxID=1263867 RepID=M2AUH3_9BACT|nr:hypothetical protein RE6C_05605 [Rhodopirellula europaea 6C]